MLTLAAVAVLALLLAAGARHEARVRARARAAGYRLSAGYVRPRPDATRPLPSRVERLR